jgi:hypothetical protein
LEEELKKSSTDLINEKIKSQSYQNELASLKKRLDDAHKDNQQHEKTISARRDEVTRLQSVEKELCEQLKKIKSDLETVNYF